MYLALLGAIGLRHRVLSLAALAATTMVYIRDPGMAHFYVVFFMSGVCATQFAQELRGHWKIATGFGLACVATALAMHLPRMAEWAIVAATHLAGRLAQHPGAALGGTIRRLVLRHLYLRVPRATTYRPAVADDAYFRRYRHGDRRHHGDRGLVFMARGRSTSLAIETPAASMVSRRGGVSSAGHRPPDLLPSPHSTWRKHPTK